MICICIRHCDLFGEGFKIGVAQLHCYAAGEPVLFTQLEGYLFGHPNQFRM